VANLMPLAHYVDAHTADRRYALWLLGLFAGLAVVLGGTGVYSVMSYSVSQRRREIAIRLALGAEPAGVRSMVVHEALRLVSAGALLGLVAAAITGRLVSGFLFGVSGFDPVTYIAVPFSLAILGIVASWVPARRASRIDAIMILHGE
jgi:putative ABC transport system permease protein